MTFKIGTVVVLKKFGHMGMITKKQSEKKKEWWIDYFREYLRTGPTMGTIVASEGDLIYVLNPELDSFDLSRITNSNDPVQRYSAIKEIMQRSIFNILAVLACGLTERD